MRVTIKGGDKMQVTIKGVVYETLISNDHIRDHFAEWVECPSSEGIDVPCNKCPWEEACDASHNEPITRERALQIVQDSADVATPEAFTAQTGIPILYDTGVPTIDTTIVRPTEESIKAFQEIEWPEDGPYGEIQVCSECGSYMLKGFCVYGGEKHYCSEDCLHKHHTPEEWLDMYYDGGDNYYTTYYNE